MREPETICPHCGRPYDQGSPSWHYQQTDKPETEGDAIKRIQAAVVEAHPLADRYVSVQFRDDSDQRRDQERVEEEDRSYNEVAKRVNRHSQRLSSTVLRAYIDDVAREMSSSDISAWVRIKDGLLRQYRSTIVEMEEEGR